VAAAASDSGAGSCSGVSSSSTASVSMGMFDEAMKSINKGNDLTHTLLDRMMDRMDQLQKQMDLVNRTAISALEANVPTDTSYVNYRLIDNQAKINELLPMLDDEMLYAFEHCLVDSAAEACDKGTRDWVRFYFPPLVFARVNY
jgi:hypothetical protein